VGKTLTSFFSFLFRIDMLLLMVVQFSKSYLNGILIRMILVCFFTPVITTSLEAHSFLTCYTMATGKSSAHTLDITNDVS